METASKQAVTMEHERLHQYSGSSWRTMADMYDMSLNYTWRDFTIWKCVDAEGLNNYTVLQLF